MCFLMYWYKKKKKGIDFSACLKDSMWNNIEKALKVILFLFISSWRENKLIICKPTRIQPGNASGHELFQERKNKMKKKTEDYILKSRKEQLLYRRNVCFVLCTDAVQAKFTVY